MREIAADARGTWESMFPGTSSSFMPLEKVNIHIAKKNFQNKRQEKTIVTLEVPGDVEVSLMSAKLVSNDGAEKLIASIKSLGWFKSSSSSTCTVSIKMFRNAIGRKEFTLKLQGIFDYSSSQTLVFDDQFVAGADVDNNHGAFGSDFETALILEKLHLLATTNVFDLWHSCNQQSSIAKYLFSVIQNHNSASISIDINSVAFQPTALSDSEQCVFFKVKNNNNNVYGDLEVFVPENTLFYNSTILISGALKPNEEKPISLSRKLKANKYPRDVPLNFYFEFRSNGKKIAVVIGEENIGLYHCII